MFWNVTLPNIKWGLLYGIILTNAVRADILYQQPVFFCTFACGCVLLTCCSLYIAWTRPRAACHGRVWRGGSD